MRREEGGRIQSHGDSREADPSEERAQKREVAYRVGPEGSINSEVFPLHSFAQGRGV